MTNRYEERQESRRERLENAADKAARKSGQHFQAARAAVDGIPMGQPILVGHHSEARHRGALRRQDSHMRQAVDADRHAQELKRRADAVGTGGISSDDPEAVAKLREQLESAKPYVRKMTANALSVARWVREWLDRKAEKISHSTT